MYVFDPAISSTVEVTARGRTGSHPRRNIRRRRDPWPPIYSTRCSATGTPPTT